MKNKQAQSMQKLSRQAQIEKYGGEEKYREEMKRRGSLGGKALWDKLGKLDKID